MALYRVTTYHGCTEFTCTVKARHAAHAGEQVIRMQEDRGVDVERAEAHEVAR